MLILRTIEWFEGFARETIQIDYTLLRTPVMQTMVFEVYDPAGTCTCSVVRYNKGMDENLIFSNLPADTRAENVIAVYQVCALWGATSEFPAVFWILYAVPYRRPFVYLVTRGLRSSPRHKF